MLQAWFTSAAYEHASVGEAGPFRYVGVVFAAFLDWLCWGQVPDLKSVLGIVIDHPRADLDHHPRGPKIGPWEISFARLERISTGN